MSDSGRGPVEPTAAGEVRVRRALLSVADKRGLVDFARGRQCSLLDSRTHSTTH